MTLFRDLQRAGWTVGDTAACGAGGLIWIETGTDGETLIEARDKSENEAWWRASEQARTLGMLRKPFSLHRTR